VETPLVGIFGLKYPLFRRPDMPQSQSEGYEEKYLLLFPGNKP
jgi:hypothetical protein